MAYHGVSKDYIAQTLSITQITNIVPQHLPIIFTSDYLHVLFDIHYTSRYSTESYSKVHLGA